MDFPSLQHIVGLTAHDRTSKFIFHPHRKTKPPTISTQFQVGPLSTFADCYCSVQQNPTKITTSITWTYLSMAEWVVIKV